MSVVGVDFGTLKTTISVARRGGVDVIVNEVSNRSTPSMVAFGPKSRYIGETAKTQEISNLKNTVSNLKRLAGRKFQDPEIEIEKQFIAADLVEAANGDVGVKVKYRGQDEVFSATQLMAMYLTKIKETAAKELKLTVSDIVLSVPAWFTDPQRRSLMDATEIAGLKLLRLMNDTTAAALGWSLRTNSNRVLPEAGETPARVAFIDIGHSTYTVSIIAFDKSGMTVLSTAFDRHFGGRNIDKALIDHFAGVFQEKYKIDIYSNRKAYFRVAVAAEKLKKVLSANTQAPINVENVMNEVDASGMLTREELEELIAPLLERVNAPLEQALAEAGLTKDDIEAIELIGGSTRVPSIKERIAEFFGKPLSYTLNQDEAIAIGCGFGCAMLSPVFRTRDFAVHDIISYPIEFTWEQSPEVPNEATSMVVFKKNNPVPSTKILTFHRKEPFDLEAKYAEPEHLPGKMSPWIGKFSVKGVQPNEENDFMVCKIKARVNLFGVLNVESGYYVEEVEVEEEVEDDAAAPAAEGMDIDNAEEPKPKATRKVKKQVKKGELPVVAGTASIDEAQREAWANREREMANEDKLVSETENAKNQLEEYIYSCRSKLYGEWEEITTEAERENLSKTLSEAEDWLYDEGDDTTKARYQLREEELRFIFQPLQQKYNDKKNPKPKNEEDPNVMRM
ncbi:heat shock protein 70 family [Pyronema domesticum]|uniref:Similar to Heat shock protein Hsp88 acc. no. O74225 n=1 Tax=Pyronema omphalodes (strain CBS 100304) TaxID=1076935 RepID=U4KVX9_PYROM|nr:heat shock protein 70 family [Pyronema domesticum]CCX05166.1 Similar to Heat shock protein Hsp88; acc. no. O74225 [Pyronema omphalodes CBS 100304]